MKDYPTNTSDQGTVRDHNVLYQSLGSFWSQLFRDQDTLKGYTKALAQEITQRYYDLVEAVNSFSVEDVPVFHKEKWLPIFIYKSKFNKEAFVYEEDNAVYGVQPAGFFSGSVFKYGEPKTALNNVFACDVDNNLKEFGVLADGILDPQNVFVYGTDVILNFGTLYFKTNIFTDTSIPRANVINENGIKVTFIDSTGNSNDEELIVLWAYNAAIDKQILFNSFGNIYKVHLDNNEFYKKVLNSVVDLNIDGPTVNNIKGITAAFLDIPTVRNSVEVVENIFTTTAANFVVTDKQCYKFASNHNIRTSLKKGDNVYVGDILVDAVDFFDNVSLSTGWWKPASILPDKLALSQHIFNGDYLNQLMFSGELELVSLNGNGDIVFPVEGNPEDVATFNAYLNRPESKTIIKEKLGLVNAADTYPLIPIDFIVNNFLKNNAALLSIKFQSDIGSRLTNMIPLVRKLIPAYVYLVVKIDLDIPTESYSRLDEETARFPISSPSYEAYADGGDADGYIESITPWFYKNAQERLFEIAQGLLPQPYNRVIASGVDLTYIDPTAAARGDVLTIKDGGVLKPIPLNATTAQYNNLLLLDFL